MKAKKVFLSLIAGALLCFSNVSYAQFQERSHHTSSSSSSKSTSSSSSDDESSSGGGLAFGPGTNIISVGVGFGGGLGAYSIPGYTTSSGVGFNASFEHALNEHWGIGLTFSYASSSLSSKTVTPYDSFGTGNNNAGQIYSYNSTETDKYTVSILGFTVRGYYHFATSAKFDPYVGIGLGYGKVTSSFTSTITPPIPGYTPVEPGLSISAAMGGVFVGARYYFAGPIGIWAEVQWEGYVANIANVGLVCKF